VADPIDVPTHLSVDDARRRIVDLCASRALGAEQVMLETALGRVLAQDVSAPFDVPGFVNAAMDGFAVRAADLPESDPSFGAEDCEVPFSA